MIGQDSRATAIYQPKTRASDHASDEVSNKADERNNSTKGESLKERHPKQLHYWNNWRQLLTDEDHITYSDTIDEITQIEEKMIPLESTESLLWKEYVLANNEISGGEPADIDKINDDELLRFFEERIRDPEVCDSQTFSELQSNLKALSQLHDLRFNKSAQLGKLLHQRMLAHEDASGECGLCNDVPSQMWAVVIGINDYKEIPLFGCIEDAHCVVAYLTEHWQVPRSNIRVLTSPHDAAAGELPATRENILQALYGHLRDNDHIRPQGDNMLIHFSGYGSTYPNEETVTRSRIEALCPVDRNDSGPYPILDISDRELNVIFSEIREKRGPNLTFSFDCSFTYVPRENSTGSLSNVRSMPPLSMKGAAQQMYDNATEDPRRLPVPDGSSQRSPSSEAWKSDMTSHVLLGACKSHETAKETLVVDRGRPIYRGVFTFALISALTSPWGMDPNTTYYSLAKGIVQRPQMQTPIVAGKRKHYRLWFKGGEIPPQLLNIRGMD